MEKSRQPFATDVLEPSLMPGTYASPIRGVHAADDFALRLASKSPNF
jgi:hypothetical protein